jgi:hypothetical protein
MSCAENEMLEVKLAERLREWAGLPRSSTVRFTAESSFMLRAEPHRPIAERSSCSDPCRGLGDSRSLCACDRVRKLRGGEVTGADMSDETCNTSQIRGRIRDRRQQSDWFPQNLRHNPDGFDKIAVIGENCGNVEIA